MIKKLGEELIKCRLNCEGINNNPKLGIIPRCLILEKRQGKKNCIVIGLNPGKCRQEERDYFLEKGLKYDSIPGYFFEKNLNNRAYFKRTRDILTVLGFDGDILWTDLVKCECIGENGTIPIQTMRVCINKFLRQEINIFKSSNIFALGNQVFDFCALSFPNHFIVGIPHPTGSHGDFNDFKKNVLNDPARFIRAIKEEKDGTDNYRAVHLSRIN